MTPTDLPYGYTAKRLGPDSHTIVQDENGVLAFSLPPSFTDDHLRYVIEIQRKAYRKGERAGIRERDDEITEAVMPVARAFAAAFREDGE